MMSKDSKMFNASQPHEVYRMARKFNEDKEVIVTKIKELKKDKKIHYSTIAQVKDLLLEEGFTLKK